MQEWQNQDTEVNTTKYEGKKSHKLHLKVISDSHTDRRQILQHDRMHHKHIELNNSNYIKMVRQLKAGNVFFFIITDIYTYKISCITLKLLHSKPLRARHGHPLEPLYKNRTRLAHHTSLYAFFLFCFVFLDRHGCGQPCLSLQT